MNVKKFFECVYGEKADEHLTAVGKLFEIPGEILGGYVYEYASQAGELLSSVDYDDLISLLIDTDNEVLTGDYAFEPIKFREIAPPPSCSTCSHFSTDDDGLSWYCGSDLMFGRYAGACNSGVYPPHKFVCDVWSAL